MSILHRKNCDRQVAKKYEASQQRTDTSGDVDLFPSILSELAIVLSNNEGEFFFSVGMNSVACRCTLIDVYQLALVEHFT